METAEGRNSPAPEIVNCNGQVPSQSEGDGTITSDKTTGYDQKIPTIQESNGDIVVNTTSAKPEVNADVTTENPNVTSQDTTVVAPVVNGKVHQNGDINNMEISEKTPLEPKRSQDDKDSDPESTDEQKQKKKTKLRGKSLRDLNGTQRRLLIALCILYFCLYTLLSLIGPFFPIEAKKKGLSALELGIVISMSWLIMFFMAPLVGFLGTKFRLQYLTTGGVAVAGLVSVLFGLLQFVHGRGLFLGLALTLRLLEGMSSATFCVTAWSVLIATMGDCIQMSMAVLMAVQGIAVIVSPLLGGLLYAAGGFLCPFVTLGIVVMLTTPLSWWVMRTLPECEKADIGSAKKFIANIGVFITCIYVMSFTLTFKFLESYVALYIQEMFDYGPQMAGIILSLACLSFVITAVIWAQVIRLIGCVPVMVLGSVLGVIVMSLIAPGHFLHFPVHPWQVFSMTCLFGVAFGASQTPAVPRLLELARKRKMPETYLTYGLVSACYNSAFDLGCFGGPLVGGVLYDYLGFGWSTFSLGCVLTLVGALILLQYLIERHYKKKKAAKDIAESNPLTEPEKVALNHCTDFTTNTEKITTEQTTTPSTDKKVQRPVSIVEMSGPVVLTGP